MRRIDRVLVVQACLDTGADDALGPEFAVVTAHPVEQRPQILARLDRIGSAGERSGLLRQLEVRLAQTEIAAFQAFTDLDKQIVDDRATPRMLVRRIYF